MNWLVVFMTIVGVAGIWWGVRIFFSKQFYAKWSNEVWNGDDSFGKEYWYNRYLRAFDSVAGGLIFLSYGVGMAFYKVFPELISFVQFVLFPAIGTIFVLCGLFILFSKKLNESFWQRVWFVQGIDKNRKLLGTHLLLWGSFFIFLLYANLYMAGKVPQIG